MEIDNLGLLAQVMNKLLQPGVRISDHHVTNLVKYFTGMKDAVTQELFDHILQLWFEEAIEIWETTAPPCSELLTLSLNIAVYLASKESSFGKLNSKNVFQRFIRFLKMAMKQLNATPNVGYISLMMSFLKHKAGSQWFLLEPYWFEIIDLALGNGHDLVFVEECYKFIARLIEKSASICEKSCTKIIHRLIKPVLDFAEVTTIQCSFDEDEFVESCSTTMYLLNSVLELITISKNFAAYEHVIKCIDEYEFENHTYAIFHKLTNLYSRYQVMNIIFTISLIDYLENCKGIAVLRSEEMWIKARKTHRFRKEMAYSNTFLVLQNVTYNAIRVCDKIRDICPKFIFNQNVMSSIEQMVYLLIYTIMCTSLKILGEEDFFEDNGDTSRGIIVRKYYRRVLPLSFYFLYEVKKYMRNNFSFNDCITTLEYIIKSRPYFSRTEANIVLNFCIYNYEDVSQAVDKEIVCTDPVAMEYLAFLIETITTFLIDFDHNWQDIFEGLSLIETTLKLLQSAVSTKKIIINGLNMIRVAVSKKLSANMALLKDEKDEEIEELLTVCVNKIDDENSEIRKAAIQVIESASTFVAKDFHTFKDIILSQLIPVKIAHMAVQDKNYLVRATALECLQEMAKVEEFWSAINTNNNIYDDICQTLIEDTYGTVRREAAKLISIVYEQRILSDTILFKFYDVMTHSVIEDTDIKTKINALEFWKNVIRRHLMGQGWIDGKFPEVTFSKDTRKIVVMTEEEIKKRLVKVLFQLSETGCLFVLTTALANQTNEFFETVQKLGDNLLTLLKEYKVDIAILEDNDYGKIKTSKLGFGFDSDMDIQKTVISRQTLHPKDFLESMNIFLHHADNDENPDEQFNIVPLLEEILYEDCDNSPVVYEEL